MKAIFAGLVPGIIWLIPIIIINKEKTKKNPKQFLIILFLGAIGSYFCYRLEMHYGSYFKKVKESNYLEILLYAIFGVAIFEEGYKWLITVTITQKEKSKKKLDILWNSLYTSISFATFENVVYYAIPYGLSNPISRMFTAYISHIGNAIWMGYLLYNANKNEKLKKVWYIIISILFPTLLHGLYNSFLYGNKYTSYFSYYYIIFIIITILISYKIKTRKD